MLTKRAVDEALPSLLGMALDYAPKLDAHDARRKIGIITQAEILPLHANGTVGTLAVSGYLFAHDFPDVVGEIRGSAQGALGMSYEIANATVPEQSTAVWAVTNFVFTGAAVLRCDKAAYPQTWIALDNNGIPGDEAPSRLKPLGRFHNYLTL